MATRAIKRRRDEGPGRDWPSLPERAPSIIKADAPTTGRVIALVSLLLVAMGLLGMLAPQWGMRYIVGPGWGFFWLMLGIGGLLFHAFDEKDQQFRRTYLGLAYVLFAVGGALDVSSFMDYAWAPIGLPCLGLALAFFTSAVRHEPNPAARKPIMITLGVAGALMVFFGFFLSHALRDFLTGHGVLYILMGLFYLLAFISMQDRGDPIAHYAALGLGALGVLSFFIALVRSIAPAYMNLDSYIIPNGLLLMGLSVVYIVISLMLCSDLQLVVLTRRELGSFFYSPMAYLLILGMTLIGWLQFFQFVDFVRERSVGPGMMMEQRGMPEPIVMVMFLDFVPVFALIFFPPLITMRLLSEEHRAGTLEVLLTAPVNDGAVVVSKFLAAMIFFVVTLLPWALFLVAFRIMGRESFDYRPLMSFFIAIMATGGGFLALGLFFSSVTRNQLIAAVLTFAVLLGLTGVFFLKRALQISPTVLEILNYTSHLDLWITSLEGQFAPRLLMFHVSMAVFFLYLTTKVLESRRWK